MSMELKLAQGKLGLLNNARPQGDPGLFGFIGDALKTGISFVRDPVGTVAGFIAGVIDGEPAPVPISVATSPAVVESTKVLNAQAFQQQTNGGLDLNFPFSGAAGAGITTPVGRLSLFENGNGANGARPVVVEGKCQGGWHPNKSSYFLRNGAFVQKGSVCVKNRRRNDFNGRAISNSMKRLTGAKKASKMIGRVTIRCGKCPGKCTCG